MGATDRRATAIVAYRGERFAGYALKTDGGWSCVGPLGMSWTRHNCRSADDARCWLRTIAGARRFDALPCLEELVQNLDSLGPHELPGILPDEISGATLRVRKLTLTG